MSPDDVIVTAHPISWSQTSGSGLGVEADGFAGPDTLITLNIRP